MKKKQKKVEIRRDSVHADVGESARLLGPSISRFWAKNDENRKPRKGTFLIISPRQLSTLATKVRSQKLSRSNIEKSKDMNLR